MFSYILDRIKKNIPSNKHYRSLMKSMLLLGFMLPFLPMTLVGGVIYYQFSNAYQKNVLAQMREATLKSKHIIDDFLMEKLNDTRFIAAAFSLDDLRKISALEGILEQLNTENESVFSALELVDGAGIPVANAGTPLPPTRSYTETPWFHEAMHARTFISDVSSDAQGHSYFTMAVRKDVMGEPWVLRSIIPVEAFNRTLKEAGIGTTGNAFILNREGQYQTNPPEGERLGEKDVSDLLSDVSMRAESGISTTQDADSSGNETTYAATSLKNGNWVIVCRQNLSESLSGLNTAKRVTLATILLSTLFLATNALRLSKKTIHRIELADKNKQKMNERMFQTGKLASIGELAAGIAHEINNPVAIMVEEAGWIDDLLQEEEFREGKNLAEFKRSLGQIRIQGKRCKEITHKLLSFARKTDFTLQRVRLNELVEDIVAISAKRAKYCGVVVRTDIQDGLPDLYLPQTEIQQVLLNLINNSLDAMGEKGGTLSVCAWLQNESI
ncbi:MAG: cache domain-containing protein, partial [Nitrospirota bacterium]